MRYLPSLSLSAFWLQRYHESAFSIVASNCRILHHFTPLTQHLSYRGYAVPTAWLRASHFDIRALVWRSITPNNVS